MDFIKIEDIKNGDFQTLSRCISLIENEVDGYEMFMLNLPLKKVNNIVGITGPPGAGKSTITNGLIELFISEGKKVAVLCIDPSSPFHFGAILGDRIRMTEWSNNPNVYIRSLATRGSLGGLHPKVIEITDILKVAEFDIIIIETVGVGQNEIEIAGLADTTIVVLVPESGDEIQGMKSGMMEIADIFVVNKSDRPEADVFCNNLRQILAHSKANTHKEIPIISTIANQKKGIEDIKKMVFQNNLDNADLKYWALAEKAYFLIQQKRMKGVDKKSLFEKIKNNEYTSIYKLLEVF